MKNIKKYLKESTVPNVTIVIINDKTKSTKKCIDSILKHTNFPTYNILIGNKDKSTKVLDYFKTLTKENNNIIVKKTTEYKTIMKYCTTDYVLLIDCAIILRNDIVNEMMRYIQNNVVGAVGVQIQDKNMNVLTCGQSIDVNKPSNTTIPNIIDNTIVDSTSSLCLLTRTIIFNKIGGINTTLTDIYRDADFCLRITDAKYKIFQCNKAVVIYDDNNTILKNTKKKYYRIWKDYTQKQNPTPNFSFLVPVTNSQEFLQLVDSIDESASYEVIFIKNKDAKYCSSVTYNILQLIADGTYTIMCHQDIILSDKWMSSVLSYINELDTRKEPWGILGIVGVDRYLKVKSLLINDVTDNSADLKKDYGIYNTQILDELCMITRNKFQFFDEDFDGFHFYGAEYSLNSIKSGFKNYVISAPVVHLSTDGSKNLQTDESWNEYRRLAKKLATKWPGHYSTTTLHITGNKIIYFLGERLNREPIEILE